MNLNSFIRINSHLLHTSLSLNTISISNISLKWFTSTGAYELATTSAGFQNYHRPTYGKNDSDVRQTYKQPSNLL